jgi:putative transposase
VSGADDHLRGESAGAEPQRRRKKLRRYEHPHHLRFLTFSTYQRLPLLGTGAVRSKFCECLAKGKAQFGFHLYAWVVMPEHVHLLLWPRTGTHPVDVVLREIKRSAARAILGRWRELRAPVLPRITLADGSTRLWQRGGGYDRNIFSDGEVAEKIAYIHNNPVERELARRPRSGNGRRPRGMWNDGRFSCRWIRCRLGSRPSNRARAASDAQPPRAAAKRRGGWWHP